MLLGLGILIASVSFICYRHPPTSWSFLAWLQRASLDGGAKPQPDAPIERDELPPPPTEQEPHAAPVIKAPEALAEIKQDLDRKAMPPPPPPFFQVSMAPAAEIKTTKAPPIPTFTLQDGHNSDPEEERDYRPSFPALNSAQRASTSINTPRYPPRLPAASASRSNNLMAPPPRPSPLPNRNPLSPSLAPPPSHTSIPAKPSKKVRLTPGHSPLDWARLTSSPNANLRGLPPNTPYLRVPPSLLKSMNGRSKDKSTGLKRDAWTALGGKVYNISPYAPFHPGGEGELMRCAGKDGTRLFAEVHPWVNWEGMLEGCLVGIAVEEGERVGGGGLEEMD